MDNNAFNVTLNQINHYQRKLEKYASIGETEKLIYCIHKLKYLPVTVRHLEHTGIGRSINALRHKNGIIGEKARALVNKWKVMVQEEEAGHAEEQDNYSQCQATKHVKPQYSETSNAEMEEYDNPSDDDRLQIQEQVDEEEQNGMAPVASYNPSGMSYENEENEEESCNGYDPRTSREDYLSIGMDTAQASYHPSGRNNSGESDEGSPERLCLPNGDATHSLKKEKSSEEGKHKKKKHKSRREHEDKYKSAEGASSSNHKKSKHKSSKSKDKHKDKEKEKESSKSKHRHSHKEHLSHSRSRESVHSKHSSPSNCSPSYHSPSYSSSNLASPNNSLSSNFVDKKRHREQEENSEIATKKSKSHASSKDKENNDGSKKHKEKRSHKSSKNSTKDEEQRSKLLKRKEGSAEAEAASGFEAALMGMEATPTKKKKKKKSKDKEKETEELQSPGFSKSAASKLPDTNSAREHLPELPSNLDDEDLAPRLIPHYKPLPQVPERKDPFTSQMTNEEALKYMLKSKNNKQRRIYSGKASSLSSVPSLFDICIRVLQENIDALEVTGGIPFSILRPVLEKATPEQLFVLEDYNPYLLEDTDVLWGSHCRKSFKNKQREDMETWREMFVRCTDEHHERMRSVTENLQKKYITKAPPKRTTQLAYVNVAAKPPKSVARAQARYGTAGSTSAQVKPPAKTDETQKAAAGSSGSTAPRPDRPFPNKPPAVKKPKVAPLMGKARQLMKKVCRR